MSMRATIALGATVVLVAVYLIRDSHQQLPEPGPAEKAPVLEPSAGRPATATAIPGEATSMPSGAAAAVPDCTVVKTYVANPDGTAAPLYTCEPAEFVSPHSYTGYSDEALASLAYADADAARILGMRLRHDDETAALSLVVRAAALAGGDPAPIKEYANAYPWPSAVDGRPVRKTVHVQFVLGSVAEILEAGSSNVAYWETRIREESTDADREIELLRQQALAIVEEMRQIQLDVTGATDLGGHDDA